MGREGKGREGSGGRERRERKEGKGRKWCPRFSLVLPASLGLATALVPGHPHFLSIRVPGTSTF
jgi:hypothetical protein